MDTNQLSTIQKRRDDAQAELMLIYREAKDFKAGNTSEKVTKAERSMRELRTEIDGLDKKLKTELKKQSAPDFIKQKLDFLSK